MKKSETNLKEYETRLNPRVESMLMSRGLIIERITPIVTVLREKDATHLNRGRELKE